MLRKETDAEGRFSFAGPFLQSGLHFGLAAYYDDIPYFSSTLEAGAQQQIILEVYEKTNDPSGIRIGTHHLFFSLRENAIECIQLLQIHNTLERTYSGRGDGRERRVTELALPMGLFNLQSHSGLLHQAGKDRFFDNQPLPPGRSQRSFSFNLDAREFASPYVHQVVYPTGPLGGFSRSSFHRHRTTLYRPRYYRTARTSVPKNGPRKLTAKPAGGDSLTPCPLAALVAQMGCAGGRIRRRRCRASIEPSTPRH